MVIVDKKNALFDKKNSISMVVISPLFQPKNWKMLSELGLIWTSLYDFHVRDVCVR